MIDLVGAPFDLCGRRPGSRMGPAAARLAGLRETLTALDREFQDLGDVLVDLEPDATPGLANFRNALSTYKALRAEVERSAKAGRTPLVIGGDHSISIGSISGALSAFGDDLAVLWIDAHADLNSPATSPSGNLHGMPLAALLGLPAGLEDARSDQWRQILAEVVREPALRPAHVGWLGLRDVDDGERRHLAEMPNAFKATMYDIDRHGLVAQLQEVDRWLRTIGVRQLWLSLDVDALDPILAPGTGTSVRGGLTYREMHLLGEMFHELLCAKDCPYRLCGLDLVEINPVYDTNNETARTAVEWIASLFGKTILGLSGRPA